MILPGLKNELGSIFCIGRNYAEHAKELGNTVPTEPLVFLKPRGSVTYQGEAIPLPSFSKEVHHEVEIVLAVGKKAVDVAQADALHYIEGYAIGIDVTARDVQDVLKKKGSPWTLAKGLPGFAPVSQFHSEVQWPLCFSLEVNGEIRQSGNSEDMIFSIPRIIAYLSKTYHLLPGDLIFTGTPAGVAPLRSGDKCLARLNGYAELKVSVT